MESFLLRSVQSQRSDKPGVAVYPERTERSRSIEGSQIDEGDSRTQKQITGT